MKSKSFIFKALSLAACITVLACSFMVMHFSVSADKGDVTVRLSADKTTVKPGQTVTVTAVFEGLNTISVAGIIAFEMRIPLNGISEVVSPDSVVTGLGGFEANYNAARNDIFALYDPTMGTGIAKTATNIMQFTLKIKEDITSASSFILDGSDLEFYFSDDSNFDTPYNPAVNPLTINVSTVKDVTGIAVKKAPTKVQYVKGQALELAGGELTVNYDWGTPETIDMTDPDVSIEGYNAATLGNQTVTVKYGGKSAAFNVTVIDKVVNSIAITTQPTKLAYIEGNTFDPAGMVITATYNDNSTSPITGYTISNTGKLAVGEKIKITFGGKEVTVTGMTVVAKTLLSIEVTTPPTRTKYMMGTELSAVDKTGMEITLTYDNGDKTKVTDVSKMSLTAGSLAAAGTATITVTCEGKTATFDLTVLDDANVKQAEQDIDEFLVDYQDVEELTDEQAAEIMEFYNEILSRELDEVELEAIVNMNSMKELFTLYYSALELLMPAYNESYLDDTVTVDAEVGVMDRGDAIDVKNGSVSAANLAALRAKYGDLTSVLKAIDMTYDAGGAEGSMLAGLLVGVKLDNTTDVVIGYFDGSGVWQEIALDKFENGFAYFYTEAGIGSYAVLKKASSTPTTTTATGATTTAPDGGNTQTGGSSAPLAACVLVLMASAAAVILTKKNAFLQK